MVKFFVKFELLASHDAKDWQKSWRKEKFECNKFVLFKTQLKTVFAVQ